MSTKYYVAIILYKSSSSSADYEPMYEESTVLVKANTEVDARKKIDVFSQSRNTKFKNENGIEISWDYYKTIDLSPMLEDEIQDITEVYSRHFKNINAYNDFETLAN